MSEIDNIIARNLARELHTTALHVIDELRGLDRALEHHLAACPKELLAVTLALDELDASMADLYEALNGTRSAERKAKEGV